MKKKNFPYNESVNMNKQQQKTTQIKATRPVTCEEGFHNKRKDFFFSKKKKEDRNT